MGSFEKDVFIKNFSLKNHKLPLATPPSIYHQVTSQWPDKIATSEELSLTGLHLQGVSFGLQGCELELRISSRHEGEFNSGHFRLHSLRWSEWLK